jgi:hypothetical protein
MQCLVKNCAEQTHKVELCCLEISKFQFQNPRALVIQLRLADDSLLLSVISKWFNSWLPWRQGHAFEAELVKAVQVVHALGSFGFL